MDLPAQVETGLVTGLFARAVKDTADAGIEPDKVFLAGQVTLRADLVGGRLRVADATPPQTIIIDPIPVVLVDGAMSVRVVADPSFTYTAEFALQGVYIKPLTFQPVAGGAVDLTIVGPTSVGNGGELFIAEAAASAASAAASAASAAVSASLVGAPADVAVAAIVGNPASATSTELKNTYLAGAPSTKTDGHNVKNLRRPTLVIDKMYPDARHDHQIVWVDEALKVAYSIGQDRRLRQSTWTAAGAEAQTFGARLSSSPDASSWAADGVFMRVPATNTLLMEQRDLGTTTNTTLQRSVNNGVAWTTVWTAPAGVRLLGPQSLCRDATTGYLFLVEYMTGAVITVANIMRSTDDGATWTAWKAMPRSETDVAGKIRHWHSCRYDTVSARVYFCAGDTSGDGGIYRVNAGGTDIEPVLLNSQIASPQPGARAVDLMFFPTHIAWPVDGDDPHVRRMARTQIGQPSPVSERIADINSTGWWTQSAAADGSVWVFSTSTEPIVGATDTASHLYACTDNGASVDEVGAVAMDGNVIGYSSLSGLCGGNGGGDSFWLRAHNYQMLPNATYSAFQLRAKVAWGATQIIKPPTRRSEYAPTTARWMAALTASQNLTYSHDRAPFRTRKMNVINAGCKVLSGTGTAKLQIFNVTTGLMVMEYAGGQSYRADSVTDTTQVQNTIVFNGYDQIEFRMIETGGVNPATVSVWIDYGWSFP